MAAMDQSPFSLLSLQEELSCSICLCPFDCPVTIPCGHNFCQDCILASWKDSYSCPQCRTHFPTKPELKENTVLSTVVETFNLRTTKSEADLGTAEDSQEESQEESQEDSQEESQEESQEDSQEESQEESQDDSQDVIRCDTCMEAEAAQTCLTCMASFCEEHLRPHRENPTFRVHQLSEPVGDLSERICPDHHKLMELFCSQHGRPICSLCLQVAHKGCSFMSPEEQRNLKECDLRGKLAILDEKITKNERVISRIGDMEDKLKDSATNRKKALAAEYQQIRDMLAREESEALNAVDCELQSGQTKLKGLSKKFNENVVNMSKTKVYIHSLLSQSQTLAFLQASVNLPKAATFDPYTPQINLDSKKVKATQDFCADLKEHLTEMFKPPVEERMRIRKPEFNNPPKQKNPPRSHSPGPPPIESLQQPVYIHIHHNAPQHPPGYNRDPMAAQKTKFNNPPKQKKPPRSHSPGPHNAPQHPPGSGAMAAQKTKPQRKGPASQHKAGPKEKSQKPKPLKDVIILEKRKKNAQQKTSGI